MAPDGEGPDGKRPARHRVVIIGSGFGGLFAAKALRRAPVDVTLIDRTNHHLFQPLLYQVATGILSEGEIAPATRDVLRRQRNLEILLAEVDDIDLTARTVAANQMDRTITVPYDSLIVSAGVHTSYFGHDEFSHYAAGMKSIDDALELRGRIFGAFESAEAEPDEAVQRAWLTFVVVGGGPTGVEMAGQIAELSHHSLRRNFRHIDPSQARVILYEGGEEILAPFGRHNSKSARKVLEQLGVEVHCGAFVTDMDDETVEVRFADGHTERIEARTKVWAAGMTASFLGHRLAEQIGAQVDRQGRVGVLPDCSLPGHPEVFVVGDLMALDGVPGMAEGAMQSGRHAAHEIERHLRGEEGRRPFHYVDLGQLAVVSRFRAVAKIGWFQIGGVLGWLLWLVVHITFLTGFKNRLGALAHWAISFMGRNRAERVITEQQVIARQMIKAHREGSADDEEADLAG
ncbi:MAG TPA: NAD(P)/FAD-dependent oxidoreductase [Acidimicrobiales bacterium]|nr:NAD(P)/FAD-dependent oxidoreductase [Acidimicrobiales bacterium]